MENLIRENQERIAHIEMDVKVLKKTMWRTERLIWWGVGVITLQFGQAALPLVSALLGG